MCVELEFVDRYFDWIIGNILETYVNYYSILNHYLNVETLVAKQDGNYGK